MATTAVIGLSAGKGFLSSSFFCSDLTEKFLNASDHGLANYQHAPLKNVIVAKKSSNYNPSFSSSNRHTQSVNALKECLDTSVSAPSTAEPWFPSSDDDIEEESSEVEYSVDAVLLLQKSMLEKQWNLSADRTVLTDLEEKTRKMSVICSGTSARQRRMSTRRKVMGKNSFGMQATTNKQLKSIIDPELRQNRYKGYAKGTVSNKFLSHSEVVRLSKKIKVGLALDKQKLRLKERLGYEPSDKELAMSLRISRAELQAKMMECSLAREKLTMSNVRLVISIAQKYDNLGGEMADLIQGGLIGLMHGIEKFDSSKGFKISTYVYWWIRQGVKKALTENSKSLRLPTHMHERVGLIRKAKIRLKEKGVTPTIANIAEHLNMTEKKVRNAEEATTKVFSFDSEAFPSLSGLPGATHHSFIADTRLENNPWHTYEKWALKNEVNKLIDTALGEREREIIGLYYGLHGESLSWGDISTRIGLSRERVRQVGLVALEKLKHGARKTNLKAMLVKR
uniref:Sigma factor n=1 Tax=Hypseocharis bilobata TaxID=253189 RepID=A0A0G2STS4_9ROSI|nr:sigma factor [Hypseocharis bilobata]